MIAAQVLQQGRKFVQLRALARVHEQGGSGEVPFTGRVQLRENGDQLYGKVVDTIKTHVFECFEDCAFARAGKASEDDELPRFASGRLLHVSASTQFFTRRWWVLGMRMSSRYLATVRRVT